MSDRLHELDQSHAIFSALSSFWWRLPILCGCFWFGHYVGLNATSGGQFLQQLWLDGPAAALGHSSLNPAFVPVSWFGTVLIGCENLWGIAYLFVIATTFLIVRLSEDYYIHGFAIALLGQTAYTVLVKAGILDGSIFSGSLSGAQIFDLIVAFLALFTWEVVVGALYWRCLRRMRPAEES